MKRLLYGDAEVGLREKFNVDSDANDSLFGEEQNENILKDTPIIKYVNPIEKYNAILDGEGILLSNFEKDNASGFWSAEVSNNDNYFSSPVEIVVDSDFKVSSNGLTIDFDSKIRVYPQSITVDWYLDDKIVSTKTINNIDNSILVVNQKVDNFNKIKISCSMLNVPHNRFRIKSLEFGEVIIFKANELKNVSISHSIDISSITMPISTLDVVLRSDRTAYFNFDEQQHIVLQTERGIESSAYISSIKRTAKNEFSIKSESVISLLEDKTYLGGIYGVFSTPYSTELSVEKISAYNLFADILDTAEVGYTIDESFKDIMLSGYLKKGSCRVALQQAAFAANAVVLTAYENGIRIVPYDTIVGKEPKEISLGRMKTQNINESIPITAVSVVGRKYYIDSNAKEKVIFEDKGEVEYGTEFEITNNNPLYDYVFTNLAEEDIIYQSVNLVKIKVKKDCKITAKEYAYFELKKTKEVKPSRRTQEKSISTATLVSLENLDKVLEKCYNYYRRLRTANVGVIDLDELKVGETAKVKATFGEDLEGVIIKQRYNLIGTTPIKTTDVIGE